MGQRPASSSGAARIAVVGATTAAGSGLRDVLAGRGVPGGRVNLFGSRRDGEALLSDYAGEARLVQEPQLDEIASHDVIFLCEAGVISDRLASCARPGSVAIDLVGALPAETRPRLVHMDLNPEAAREHGGFLAVPHSLSLLLTDLLHPLEREFGIEEVVGVVLRPAADFGDPAVEELRDQVVRLLNFAAVPVEIFGRQLAFNVIPTGAVALEPPDVDARIARDVTELLGWSEPRMALRLLTVPMFHGHGVQLRLRLRGRPSADALQERVGAGSAESPLTPLEASADGRRGISAPVPDGLGGFWLWAVEGQVDGLVPAQAVRLAQVLSDL